MDSNKWQKLVTKEFLSSDRRAALYFIIPEFVNALERLKTLESENLKFLFPVKSFNHPQILSIVSRYTSGFDVSNANEFNDIKSLIRPEHIVWNSSPINCFIAQAQFNDLNSFSACARSDFSGFSVRINPDFVQPNNRFGIESTKVAAILANNKSLNSLHCHLSGISNTKEDYFKLIDHIAKLVSGIGEKLNLNLGGGLSSMKFDDLIEVTSYAKKILVAHQVYFEPGRWLSKQCGLAVGRVVACERNIITTTLSAACHLRWLDFDSTIAFNSNGTNSEPVTYYVYGPTCFENDKLGSVTLPSGTVTEGQLLLLNHLSGYSYGWNHAFNGVDKADVVFLGTTS